MGDLCNGTNRPIGFVFTDPSAQAAIYSLAGYADLKRMIKKQSGGYVAISSRIIFN